MLFKHSKNCSHWPVLLALLILTISGGILIGGIEGLFKFRNAIGAKFEYDIVSIHFFTKEFIARQYQKFTAEPLPIVTTLPSFHLFVDEKDLESLEENLPASAKLQYKQSHLKIDDPAFSGEAQFRYRGGLPLHWLYDKKSIRVKLPPFSTYRNERRFNLVNPPLIYTILDWVSYDMARSIGLLTPEYFPARVFINNETNGLHFFLSGVDESLLRKNNRMPGSIYEGDSRFISNPFGTTSGIGDINFRIPTDNNIAALWTDERLWEKTAARNAESSADREDFKVFFSAIDETNSLKFMQAFDTYFDKEKFYLFWGLDQLLGAYHHDLFHNHKIYFDPYRGKFEPIEWDIRFWTTSTDLPVTPLFKQIKLNPILKYENYLITYKLWKKFTVDHVIGMIDGADNIIKDELAADPYRQHSDSYNKYFGLDKVMPFSMNEYTDAIKELKQIYRVRHGNIEQLFNFCLASYHVEKTSEDQIQITIAIDGNSPIDFDPWSIIPGSLHESVELSRVYEDKTYPVSNHGQLDILYPGIKINEFSDEERMVAALRTISTGKYKYLLSPLYYRYLIKGVHSTDVIKTNELTGRNVITSNIVTINKIDDLPDNSDTQSLHPWRLLSQTKSIKDEIILSGEIEVYYDLVFTGEQKVTILPGTIFKLYKNSSIFFYGKITAKGTAELPIVFKPMKIGDPWGSIVLQGKEASGSYLSHIKVSGGSVALRNLIHYPGQLNIHDVDSFHLEYCQISNNSIGDDALHIAYSQGHIQHCEFKNTAFDALDMDIVDVTVSDTIFFNIGNDAIDLMNSKTVIDNVNIIGSGDKCISVGEASQVNIQNSQLKNCQLGIAIKDQSTAQVNNIEFTLEPGNAIALYRKNPRYSKGGELQGDRLYGITEKDIVVGDYSINNIQKSAYLPSRNLEYE